VKAFVAPNIKPQAYISASQAAVACLLANKHLCSLSEVLIIFIHSCLFSIHSCLFVCFSIVVNCLPRSKK